MAHAWVIVADRAAARIFAASDPVGPLEEVESLSHPESRLREQDLMADRPGRTFERVGDVRHAKEPPVSAKDHEALAFAGEIADRLERARVAGTFGVLILVAGPGFLGMMRDKLTPQTVRMVRAEIDKNIVGLSPKEIRAHLPERLYSTL